ncbi:MAG TPA: hypothetical protein VFO86_14445, partial [Terriglobia bacterium]|nr:hypothetical protein [Terriglobia bacterium]
YYASLADGSFALTNDILKLRKKLSSVQLDEQAFYELVRFGHCYGTKTLIKSIYSSGSLQPVGQILRNAFLGDREAKIIPDICQRKARKSA